MPRRTRIALPRVCICAGDVAFFLVHMVKVHVLVKLHVGGIERNVGATGQRGKLGLQPLPERIHLPVLLQDFGRKPCQQRGVGVNGRPGEHGQQIVFLVFMMLVRRAGKITQHRGGGLLHFLRASLARGRPGKLLHGAQLLADAVMTMFQHRDGLVEIGCGVEQGSIHRLLPWKVRSPGCLQAAV